MVPELQSPINTRDMVVGGGPAPPKNLQNKERVLIQLLSKEKAIRLGLGRRGRKWKLRSQNGKNRRICSWRGRDEDGDRY